MKLKESDLYIKKNIVNWQYDAWKMKDLYYLTAFVGPFTTTEEIDTFMTGATETKGKNKHIYEEVRYANKTCLSLKHSILVIRLRMGHKILNMNEYARILKKYV